MSQDELSALADCVAILIDDIRKQKQTRSAVLLADDTDRAGDSGTQETAPADDVSLAHDCK